MGKHMLFTLKHSRLVQFSLSVAAGLVVAMFIERLLVEAPKTQPDKLSASAEQINQPKPTQKNGAEMKASMELVAIQLPAPPPLQVQSKEPERTLPINKAKPVSTNKPKSSEQSVARAVASKAKHHATLNMKPALTSMSAQKISAQTKQVDTQTLKANTKDSRLAGLRLIHDEKVLEHWEISISMPSSPSERQRIAKVLRNQLGVTLGKVDTQGKLLVRETNTQASPFVRLVEGGLTPTEQRIVYPWKNQRGTIVRFYPLSVDAELFGALKRMGLSPSSNVQISAQYQLTDSKLFLSKIAVDGLVRKERILIADSV